MARVLGAFARKESDDKSRRIRRKHEELAQAGKLVGGGSRPYGFEGDRRTIRESEALIIRECARRVLAGESVRSVCRDLNERGVGTSTGKAWTPHVMRRMLLSGRISGQR
jgi:DNA invertase Pin-like site-specific DNA recombinase